MKTLIFLNRVSKNIEISDLMKIRPVGAELFHVDGRTDMTKLIVAFRHFANAPKNSTFCPHVAFMLFLHFSEHVG